MLETGQIAEPVRGRLKRRAETGSEPTDFDPSLVDELLTTDERPEWSESEPQERTEVAFARFSVPEKEHSLKEAANHELLALISAIHHYLQAVKRTGLESAKRSSQKREMVQAGKNFHHALFRFYAIVTPYRENGDAEIAKDLHYNINAVRRMVEAYLRSIQTGGEDFSNETETIAQDIKNNLTGVQGELVAADALDRAAEDVLEGDFYSFEPLDVKDGEQRIDEDGQGVDLWFKIDDASPLVLGVQVKSIPIRPGSLTDHLFVFSCEADIQKVLDKILDVNVLSPHAYREIDEKRANLERSMRKLLTIQGGDRNSLAAKNAIPALVIVPSADFEEALDSSHEPAYEMGRYIPTESYLKTIRGDLQVISRSENRAKLLTRSLLYANNQLGPQYEIYKGEPQLVAPGK